MISTKLELVMILSFDKMQTESVDFYRPNNVFNCACFCSFTLKSF